ncbi:MAG TPA: acyl-CoA dehydrogenase family protein [Acidimicrobiales bacterium]|nr:acyl-CoA dehydrogenase family protein [Acidimicrobiales bacterium]
MELDQFRVELDRWIDLHREELTPEEDGPGTLDQHVVHLARVKRLAYDAGWMRWGWPERVGGLGGSSLLRAYLGEALTARDLVEPGIFSMTETLVPTMVDFAPPTLAAEMVPRLLRGEETWCQGFSEPGTGSNLAALSCRAVRAEDGWRVTGQKVWTSLAQYAQRCVLLTRSGPADANHSGITALFVDMSTPGITVHPVEAIHGAPEFCEVFFDDVPVPLERTLGAEGHGWAVAMALLPYERSTALWHRSAHLQLRFQQLLETAPEGSLDPSRVGETAELLFSFRARSRATQHRLAAGDTLGPETSIDKVLVAAAEQAVFDLAAEALGPEMALGDDAASGRWRSEYLFSRAATIYGGTAEIQRDIIARRLLDLGRDR